MCFSKAIVIQFYCGKFKTYTETIKQTYHLYQFLSTHTLDRHKLFYDKSQDLFGAIFSYIYKYMWRWNIKGGLNVFLREFGRPFFHTRRFGNCRCQIAEIETFKNIKFFSVISKILEILIKALKTTEIISDPLMFLV